MNNIPFHLRFPENIELRANSLAEAWLEIRWQLTEIEPNVQIDTEFDMAIGKFYENIKSRFSHRKALDNNRIPIELAPFLVRYQFRNEENSWPLLQLGSGVASVNFNGTYNWTDFRNEALILREQLTKSYEQELKTEGLFLRYKNTVLFDYKSNNLFTFLSDSLNTSVQPPLSIPGDVGVSEAPTSFNIGITYKLKEDIGVGAIKINTGRKKETDDTTETTEVIIFDLEVGIRKEKLPNLYNAEEFDAWLTSAHSILHDWYFSLIDGQLRQEYEGK